MSNNQPPNSSFIQARDSRFTDPLLVQLIVEQRIGGVA